MGNAIQHADSSDTASVGLAGPARLWFVDNLRILLTSLVILHHIATMYSGTPLWYYFEKPSSAAVGLGLNVFMLLNQSWFMGAFFLLSGYFTPGSYDRKGPRAFLRDRLMRLGIPLLVFYFVLNPLLLFVLGAYDGGSPLGFYLHAVGSGPLWFVLALLIFDLSYAGFRLASRGSSLCSPGRRSLTYPTVIGFVVALAVVTYVLRTVIPIGYFVPVIGFPTSAYLPQYISFFVLGTVAYRRGWLSTTTAAMGRVGLGLAIGATLVFLPLALTTGTDPFGHATLSSLFYALWDSAFAVGIILALFIFFRHRFNTDSPLRRYLSSHVFAVYVIHAFVVTAVGCVLRVVDLPTLAKFAIAGVVVLPACYLLAGPVRRLPGVRHVL